MRQISQARTRIHVVRQWAGLWMIVLGALMGSSRPACAQIEMRSFYQGYSPTVSRDDVDALTETLDLDENAQQLVKAVYEGYRRAYNAASDAARDSLSQIRQSMGTAENEGVRANLFSEYNRLQDEWGHQSAGFETGFFSDIKNLLTKEQMTRWPRYERDRRRRVGLLLAARLMPERVDLVALLDSLKLPDEVRDAIEPTVDRYTVEFDEPLRERIRLSDQMEALSYAINGKGDDAQMHSMQDRLVRLHVRIRDLNLQFVDVLAQQLPSEDGERLRLAFRKRVWPRIFGSDPIDTDVNRIRGLAKLTERQEEAVASLVASYKARLEPINDQLVQVEMTREMLRLSPPVAQGTGPIQSVGSDNPETVESKSEALLDSRQTLVQSTQRDIRTLLTADQLQALSHGSNFGVQEDNRQ